MKRALIATLFNEADNVSRWWNDLMRQTVLPDEIVIVDGGSTDGTWERLQALAAQCPVPVKLEQRRCNIAAGRNRAIQLTDADIIASTDAGSFPAAEWFDEITRPLLENPGVDAVGGRSVPLVTNDFQRALLQLDSPAPEPQRLEEVLPSSRNIAFRREAWQAVGGYPEWLTLTAEDALFNHQLHAIGRKFLYNAKALVTWPVRDNPDAYFKMLRLYGVGAAEAQMATRYFLKRTLIVLFPPALLLSRWRWRHFGFRYRKNLASARGWFYGKIHGRRPPPGWRCMRGTLMSPQAQSALATRTPEIDSPL